MYLYIATSIIRRPMIFCYKNSTTWVVGQFVNCGMPKYATSYLYIAYVNNSLYVRCKSDTLADIYAFLSALYT